MDRPDLRIPKFSLDLNSSIKPGCVYSHFEYFVLGKSVFVYLIGVTRMSVKRKAMSGCVFVR